MASKKGIGQDLWNAEKKVLKTNAKVLASPLSIPLRLAVGIAQGPVYKTTTNKKGVVSKRMTKQAQSINMDKIKAKKASAVVTKRKTAEGIKALTKKNIDNKRKTGS